MFLTDPTNDFTMSSVLEKLYTRNYWTFAAFGVLFADYLATFVVEFSYIWRKPFTFTKLTFWYSRYIGLLGQGLNCYLLLTTLSPTRVPVNPDVCRYWYTYQFILFWLLFTAADVLLMLRVAAMYNCHRIIRVGLVVFLLIELALGVAGAHQATERATFNAACELQGVSYETTTYGMVFMLSQVVIWLLTVSRKTTLGVASPILSSVVRDAAWAIMLFALIFLFTIPYSMATQVARSEFVFAWPTTLLSLMTCRLIVNMHEAHHCTGGEKNTALEDQVP